MSNTLYRAPFYADSTAITEEHVRHHPVVKRRVNGTDWEIQCSCGATAGPGEETTVIRLWDHHYQTELRKP